MITTPTATQGAGDWLLARVAGDHPVNQVDLDLAERAIRDLTSVAIRGSTTRSVAAAAAFAAAAGGTGSSLCWPNGHRTDPVTAAFVNGTAGQALDFDDIHPLSVSHLSSITVPAVAALANEMTASPVEAVARAMFIADCLGTLMGLPAYRRGFQPTHTVGTLAAVGGLVHGLGLPRAQREAALGLVATHAIGLRAHTGTSYKAMQSGVAASAAVRSVMLARVGVTAGLTAVDVMFGIIGIGEDLPATLPDGPSFLAVKQFPTCGGVHAAVEAVLALRQRWPTGEGRDTASMSVSAPPRHFRAMHFYPPRNPDEARFSYRYCMATAWVYGEITPEHFAPSALGDPVVATVMAHIELVPDDLVGPDGDDVTVTVRGKSRTDSQRVPERNGYPTRPLAEDIVRRKFISCLTPRFGAERSDGLYGEMRGPRIFDAIAAAIETPGGL